MLTVRVSYIKAKTNKLTRMLHAAERDYHRARGIGAHTLAGKAVAAANWAANRLDELAKLATYLPPTMDDAAFDEWVDSLIGKRGR